MILKAIVAASDNNVIGVGQDIPWHLPDDFKYFKAQTTGFPIIMGKNTWLTFPKPLPNRLHVVLSTSLKKEDVPESVLLFTSMQEAQDALKLLGYSEAFLIGGGMLYDAYLPLVDEVLLTRVHTNIKGGTAFFPELSNQDWKLLKSIPHEKDEKHSYNFTFEIWNRISNA